MGMLIEDTKALLARLENSQSPHVEASCIRVISDFLRQRGERIRIARAQSNGLLRNDPESENEVCTNG